MGLLDDLADFNLADYLGINDDSVVGQLLNGDFSGLLGLDEDNTVAQILDLFTNPNANLRRAGYGNKIEIPGKNAAEREKWVWENLYQPLEKKAINQVLLPIQDQPGFQRMLASADRTAQNAGALTVRNAAQATPWGGGLADMERSLVPRSRGLARAGAVKTAEQDAWTNLLSLTTAGRQLTPVGKMAPSMVDQAALSQKKADSAYSAAGSSIGNLLSMWLMNSDKGGGDASGYWAGSDTGSALDDGLSVA